MGPHHSNGCGMMLEKELEQNCGIYYIQNTLTHQIYIGQSKTLKQRKKRHFYNLRHNKHENPYLQNSFNKYGEPHFEYGVIQYCDEKDLDELEIAYMNLFNVKKHGFNISDGGYDGGWRKDYAHIKLSSFNRHNQRMYSLVYKENMIRSIDKSFLEYLLKTYFDENGVLKVGYSFSDLKQDAKLRMGSNYKQEARIVKKGKLNDKQLYALKYGKEFIKFSINKCFLEYLLNKFFNEKRILKSEYTIEDIKKEKGSNC